MQFWVLIWELSVFSKTQGNEVWREEERDYRYINGIFRNAKRERFAP